MATDSNHASINQNFRDLTQIVNANQGFIDGL